MKTIYCILLIVVCFIFIGCDNTCDSNMSYYLKIDGKEFGPIIGDQHRVYKSNEHGKMCVVIYDCNGSEIFYREIYDNEIEIKIKIINKVDK